MLWSINSCQNRISADQYHLTVPRAQMSTNWGRVLFWSCLLTSYQLQMIAGSSLIFPMIHMKYVVFMSLWPLTVKILISNWPRTRKLRQLFNRTAGSNVDPLRSSIFLKLSADKLPTSNDRGLKSNFSNDSYEICCVYVTMAPYCQNFDFKLTSDAKTQAAF